MQPKSLFPIVSFLLLSVVGFTQDESPYRSIGKMGKILTLSDGKYDENFDKDSLELVGSVIVNRYTRKIEKLLLDNSIYERYATIEQSRFLSVDPVTKKFAELSPYQYSSNRPIDGKDLDGLEWKSTGKYFNSVTGKYEIDYSVTLSLKNDKNILSLANDKAQLSTIERNAENILSKADAKGSSEDPIISTDIIFTDKEGPLKVAFFNAETIRKLDPKTGEVKTIKDETYAGKTDVVGQSQTNFISLPLSNAFILDQSGRPSLHSSPIPASDEELGRSFSHELGHTAGLRHPFEDPLADDDDVTNSQGLLPEGNPLLILLNLMNSPRNPIVVLNPDKQGMKQGTELTADQRKKIEKTVQEQQPKKD